MQSLPPEVLRLVIGQLPASSRWPFAQTCRVFYKLIRPALFRVKSLKLTITAGCLDTEQLERHEAILSSKHDGQPAGIHIELLGLLFEHRSAPSHANHTHAPGVLAALSRLLQHTPSVRRVNFTGIPGCVYSDTKEKCSTEKELFQRSLRNLGNLQVLDCSSADETFRPAPGANEVSSVDWVQAILPGLPDSLHKLYLLPNFTADRNLEAVPPISFTQARTPVKDLYFSCSEAGRACDELLSSLLDNSPLLRTVTVGDQYLSEGNVIALFGRDRPYEHLKLETGDIPRVPHCRQGLQRQSNLKHLEASCGSDFLYYLPSLPQTITTIKLNIHTLDPLAFGRTRGCLLIGEVWELLGPCLEDTEWCPQLSVLHIKLIPWAEDMEYDHYEDEAKELRKEALKLLRKRKVVPRTNKGFCRLQF